MRPGSIALYLILMHLLVSFSYSAVILWVLVTNMGYVYIFLILLSVLHLTMFDLDITIHLTCYNLYILMAYPPSSNTLEQIQALITYIISFCGKKDMGDINQSSLHWDEDSSRVSPQDISFLGCFSSLGLTQWAKESTFITSGNILYLVLTSEEDRTGNVCVTPPFPRCYHSPLFFTYIYQDNKDMLCRKPHPMWHEANFRAINSLLEGLDWELFVCPLHCGWNVWGRM